MEQINNTLNQIRLPLIVSITLAVGILIGTQMQQSPKAGTTGSGLVLFNEILKKVDAHYVDTVNTNVLIDGAIAAMLEQLDPHSVYTPAREVELAAADLNSGFDGIGIEFQLIKDTLNVVSVILGGPSDHIGLKDGDKIVMVNDTNIAGIGISSLKVMRLLRGPKGTKVKVHIKRRGEKDLMVFTITRDKIPTFSIEAAFMIDNQTGFIKISRFARTTYEEFREALAKLKASGMKRLMLDLRDNGGGYMDKAVNIADDFLDDKKLIVYTDGRMNEFDEKFYAERTGPFEEGNIIVLIDEGSASASEILAGALQDNDRALIVGRRSYGKGLVQRSYTLSDGSDLRLTISRYYTPSGRSIQKPYEDNEDYDMDLLNRYRNGELYALDSSKMTDSLKYKTLGGRAVYGGGGIMPDVFIPHDTTYYTKFLGELYSKGVIREYTLLYLADNKVRLEAMTFQQYLKGFVVTEAMMQDMLKVAATSGVVFNSSQYNRSKPLIMNHVKAYIARGIWKNDGYYQVLYSMDHEVQKAMTLWNMAGHIVN